MPHHVHRPLPHSLMPGTSSEQQPILYYIIYKDLFTCCPYLTCHLLAPAIIPYAPPCLSSTPTHTYLPPATCHPRPSFPLPPRRAPCPCPPQAAGLALPLSDLDIVLTNVEPGIEVTRPGEGLPPAARTRATKLLRRLAKQLQKLGLLQGKAQVITARVGQGHG